MAEDSDLERNYPATPRRLEQARERGQVARSRELTTAAVALAGSIGLSISGSGLFDRYGELFRKALTLDRAAAFEPARLTESLSGFSGDALLAVAPLLAVILAATIAAPLLLSGWVVSGQALLPDFSRINPMKGLSNLWSKQSLAELVKAIVKAVLLSTIGWLLLRRAFDALQSLAVQGTAGAVAQVGTLIESGFYALTGGLTVIALIDVPWVIWRHRDSLKMSREDMRQELRESEGDPQLKSRIRSLQRAAARRRMLAAVPKASVIVTNPTHYAVALQYAEGSMRAPRVVAKGADLVAARIREIGREHGVPLLEAPPVARALFRHVELDAEIPATLYSVVARVLAYVHQLRHFQAHGGLAPSVPTDLAVPEGMDPAAA